MAFMFDTGTSTSEIAGHPKAGNLIDIGSLLIHLDRSLSIPSRFVTSGHSGQ